MANDFVAPGPGSWELDRSHFPGGATPVMQWVLSESMPDAFGRLFAELGIPADRMDCGFVNGFMYTRLRPLIAADRPSTRLPPNFVLRIVTRLHPAFRARTRAAQRALVDRPSIDVVHRWTQEIRPRLIAENRSIQHIDPTTLDDESLQAHVGELLDVVRRNSELHFWLHGHDLGPIARYLHACLGWGLDADEVLGALAGASPATTMPVRRLVELRALVESSPTAITSLDAVRAISNLANELLEQHLDDHGHVLATGYDVTSPTLIELPEVVLATIRSASSPAEVEHETLIAGLAARIPADERSRFDQLCADARLVMDMRDDNGPLTFEWPAGLLRRAMLVVGQRLGDRDELADRTHVFELEPDEIRTVFASTRPSAAELAERAAARAACARLIPPDTLGTPEPEPPLSVLPGVLADGIAATKTAIDHMGMGSVESDRDPLCGAGIGTEVYVGTARVADSADDAIERMEPGDVLVVRATSPAFNLVLSIAGGVVTADGGAMSHAAVLSRELGLAAVIGAPGALDISDGSRVEVDPVHGVVRVL